jgi:hypothetical protein
VYKELPDLALTKSLENDSKMGLIKPTFKIITPEVTGNLTNSGRVV